MASTKKRSKKKSPKTTPSRRRSKRKRTPTVKGESYNLTLLEDTRDNEDADQSSMTVPITVDTPVMDRCKSIREEILEAETVSTPDAPGSRPEAQAVTPMMEVVEAMGALSLSLSKVKPEEDVVQNMVGDAVVLINTTGVVPTNTVATADKIEQECIAESVEKCEESEDLMASPVVVEDVNHQHQNELRKIILENEQKDSTISELENQLFQKEEALKRLQERVDQLENNEYRQQLLEAEKLIEERDISVRHLQNLIDSYKEQLKQQKQEQNEKQQQNQQEQQKQHNDAIVDCIVPLTRSIINFS